MEVWLCYGSINYYNPTFLLITTKNSREKNETIESTQKSIEYGKGLESWKRKCMNVNKFQQSLRDLYDNIYQSNICDIVPKRRKKEMKE